jgi:hypothetical protein
VRKFQQVKGVERKNFSRKPSGRTSLRCGYLRRTLEEVKEVVMQKAEGGCQAEGTANAKLSLRTSLASF